LILLMRAGRRRLPECRCAGSRRVIPRRALTGEARNLTCSTTPDQRPRRLASDSFSDATATRSRRWRSGGAASTYFSATARCAAAPIVAKYTGVLAAADIKEFTYTTTFQIMQSLRLDQGLGVSRPVNP
jgi:hypothetical protein